jgi:hypothetical protein
MINKRLSDEEIDYLERRVLGVIDGTGTPWGGIGPDELLCLISEVKELRKKIGKIKPQDSGK